MPGVFPSRLVVFRLDSVATRASLDTGYSVRQRRRRNDITMVLDLFHLNSQSCLTPTAFSTSPHAATGALGQHYLKRVGLRISPCLHYFFLYYYFATLLFLYYLLHFAEAQFVLSNLARKTGCGVEYRTGKCPGKDMENAMFWIFIPGIWRYVDPVA